MDRRTLAVDSNPRKEFDVMWKTVSAAILLVSAMGCGGNRLAEEPADIVSVGAIPSSMEFVGVPGGTFIAGSPGDEPGRVENEEPMIEVTIEPFELLSTPVTWDMWNEVMGEESEIAMPRDGVTGSHPVTGVTWADTWRFLERLHRMDPAHFYGLPSETQWEYACRAGTTTRFFWGDSEDPGVVGRYCWYWGNSEGSTQEVGLLEPNPWGLYDMNGNVMEWCHDTWADNYETTPLDGSYRESSGIPYRVVRGGSWRSDTWALRSAYRFSYRTVLNALTVGFRVARTPSP